MNNKVYILHDDHAILCILFIIIKTLHRYVYTTVPYTVSYTICKKLNTKIFGIITWDMGQLLKIKLWDMYKVASSTDFFNPIVHILYTAYSEKF